MDRLYERLTPTERFQIAVAAFGRGDHTEVDRLNDSAPWRAFKIQEPAYFDRLQRITWLSLYFSVHARNLQAASLAVFAAMVMETLKTERSAGSDDDEEDIAFEQLHGRCVEQISRLKALHSAWESFCAGLGVSANDTDKMIGLPFLGCGGALDLIEEIVGEVESDEDYRQQCLGHMTEFWNIKIHDRGPE